MFTYCRVEDAAAEHQRLLGWEKEMLAKIEVPYRVIDTAAGDLGGSAARKFDCEAWVPTQGRYRELTSTSNCTTYQARRLGIRERDPHGLGHPRRRDAQRHARHDPLAGRDPGEPPAGRRLGRRAQGAAAVPRPRGPQAGLKGLMFALGPDGDGSVGRMSERQLPKWSELKPLLRPEAGGAQRHRPPAGERPSRSPTCGASPSGAPRARCSTTPTGRRRRS